MTTPAGGIVVATTGGHTYTVAAGVSYEARLLGSGVVVDVFAAPAPDGSEQRLGSFTGVEAVYQAGSAVSS